MSISQAGSRQQLISPRSILKGTLIANGAEQVIIDTTQQGKVSGYLDLSQIQAGDTVRVRQYMLIDGIYRLYADDSYSGVQPQPMLFITPKPVADAVRLTLQQIAGVNRSFEYDILVE